MTRARVRQPLKTGVRVIDLFTPLCQGQRVGIFAGSGVGKSTILSMIAQAAAFDTVVLALVGERGREVREFLEGPLADNRARADRGRLHRRREPDDAAAGAALGHGDRRIFPRPRRVRSCSSPIRSPATPMPPATLPWRPANRPWPAAIRPVFSVTCRRSSSAPGRAPRAPARSPASSPCWSTATTTTIPVADAIRGTLDGHIVLDRAIADQGRYPAVNVLASISRLAQHRAGPTEQRTSGQPAQDHDRPLRGHPRPAADGRLPPRQRRRTRPRRGRWCRASTTRCARTHRPSPASTSSPSLPRCCAPDAAAHSPTQANRA